MNRGLIALAFVLVAAGCGSEESEPRAAGGQPRVERCVERFLERAEGDDTAEVERYVRTAYCEPFAKRAWVHEDGTLSIDAYRSQGSADACAAQGAGETTRTLPCDDTRATTLDCGVLDLVRRAEVQEYVAERQQDGAVRCDDGTPLDELGAE